MITVDSEESGRQNTFTWPIQENALDVIGLKKPVVIYEQVGALNLCEWKITNNWISSFLITCTYSGGCDTDSSLFA